MIFYIDFIAIFKYHTLLINMNAPMDLVKKDLYLYEIDDQIKLRRNLILEKNKSLNKKKKTNHFLEEVKNDYQKYYQYIIHEKQQQYDSMKILQVYLEDLIKMDKINNIELKNAKYEQKQILDEMDKIKMELDQIIKK